MSTLRTLALAGLGIAAIHGFIYRQTGDLDPCSAATKRLNQEYPVSNGNVGFALDYLDALPGSSNYGWNSPYLRDSNFRDSLAKSLTLKRWGVAGCYVPAVFGWGVVPPSPLPESDLR